MDEQFGRFRDTRVYLRSSLGVAKSCQATMKWLHEAFAEYDDVFAIIIQVKLPVDCLVQYLEVKLRRLDKSEFCYGYATLCINRLKKYALQLNTPLYETQVYSLVSEDDLLRLTGTTDRGRLLSNTEFRRLSVQAHQEANGTQAITTQEGFLDIPGATRKRFATEVNENEDVCGVRSTTPERFVKEAECDEDESDLWVDSHIACSSTVHRRKPFFGEVKFLQFMEDCKGSTAAKVQRLDLEAREENQRILLETNFKPVSSIPPEEDSDYDPEQASQNELDRSLIELSGDETEEEVVTME